MPTCPSFTEEADADICRLIEDAHMQIDREKAKRAELRRAAIARIDGNVQAAKRREWIWRGLFCAVCLGFALACAYWK